MATLNYTKTEDPMNINKYSEDKVKPKINYEYLGRLTPSKETEDFNDPTSQRSQDTASLLSSMQDEIELKRAEKAKPLSQKMFEIMVAKEEARRQAKDSLVERRLKLDEDLMKLKLMNDAKKEATNKLDKINQIIIDNASDLNDPTVVEHWRNVGTKLVANETPTISQAQATQSNIGIPIEQSPQIGTQIGEETVPDKFKSKASVGLQKAELEQKSRDIRDLRKYAPKLVDEVKSQNDVLMKINDLEKKLGFKLEDYTEQDIPGKTIPVIGTRVATPKSKEIDNIIQGIYNAKLYDSSGKAINEEEMKRILAEMGYKGLFQSEEGMMNALKRYKDYIITKAKNTEFAYDPKVVEDFKKRGGKFLFDNDNSSKEGQPKKRYKIVSVKEKGK